MNMNIKIIMTIRPTIKILDNLQTQLIYKRDKYEV